MDGRKWLSSWEKRWKKRLRREIHTFQLVFDALFFPPCSLSLWHMPSDQPESSKCMMPLLLKYKSILVGDGLELKTMAERLFI